MRIDYVYNNLFQLPVLVADRGVGKVSQVLVADRGVGRVSQYAGCVVAQGAAA